MQYCLSEHIPPLPFQLLARVAISGMTAPLAPLTRQIFEVTEQSISIKSTKQYKHIEVYLNHDGETDRSVAQ